MHGIYEGDVNVLTKKVWPTTRNNMSHFRGGKIRAGIDCAKMKYLWFATEKDTNTIPVWVQFSHYSVDKKREFMIDGLIK